MSIYVLIADGHYLLFSGTGKVLCRKAFRDWAGAEAYVPEFLLKAQEDRGGLTELDPDTVKVSVVELDLV